MSQSTLLVIKPATSAPLDTAHALRNLFQLTELEARVVEEIGGGSAPALVAEMLGVSVITVRNQLASAMAKMGVHRQAEIVALVANLTPRLTGLPQTNQIGSVLIQMYQDRSAAACHKQEADRVSQSMQK